MLIAYKRIFPRLRLPEPKTDRESDSKPGVGPEAKIAGGSESKNGERVGAEVEGAIDWPTVLRENLPPLSDTLYPIHRSDANNGAKNAALWLITAGWRSGDRFPAYAQAVRSLEWSGCYTSSNGAA